MEYRLGIVCVLLTLLSSCTGEQKRDSSEDSSYRKLYHALMDDYLPAVLPVGANQSMKVHFGSALYSINELNEKEQTLSATLWLRMLWNDENLKWNASEYDGIDAIRIDARKLWKPDIVLYNTRDELYQTMLDVNAVVYNTGEVLFVPPINVISSCPVDLRSFPFDEQTCIMKFGSWTFSSDQVDLDLYEGMEGFDLNDYVENSEWKVVETTGAVNHKKYPCCEELYPDVTMNITIERISTYYSYMFVGPGVVLSLLIPFVFILPARSLQKVPLGIGIAICLVLLTSMLENFMPGALPSIPIIAYHYVGSLTIVCVSLGLNAFIANFAHRGNRTNAPPEMLKKVFLGVFRPLVCIAYDPSKDVEVVTPDPAAVREWEILGMVIDRILFLIFLIIVILECIAIFS